MNILWKWWLRRWCALFGHKEPILFHEDGAYWCDSAGPYDCICLRCGRRWEDTPEGAAALIRSQRTDPRVGIAAEIRRDKALADMLTRLGVR